LILSIDDTARLELIALRHAEGLFHAVDNNRAHLSEFLPWVGNMQSVNDFTEYIKNCESLIQQGKEISFVIIENEVIIGRVGLHYINLQNKNAAIGYWLTRAAEGRGIITRSCQLLIKYGFEKCGLHRIEIKAAVDNTKSQSIPVKLGFTREGIMREAEWVNNRFLDLVLYSLLSKERKPGNK
jgi:ribosomal-protein-serine acetyltransferase